MKRRLGASRHPTRVRDMAPRAPMQRNQPFHLWMIDFDKVSRFKPSWGENYRREAEQLVRNTRTTDGPYYPRALPNTEGVWKMWLAFATTYISASKIILNSTLRQVVDLGASVPEKELNLIFKRPSRVMNEWMRAESVEYNMNLDRFIDQAKREKWMGNALKGWSRGKGGGG